MEQNSEQYLKKTKLSFANVAEPLRIIGGNMKEITIIIAGPVASGKSRLTYLLKNFLRSQNFNVIFDGDMDFETEKDFDNVMMKNNIEIMGRIKENTNITLRQVQTNRSMK